MNEILSYGGLDVDCVNDDGNSALHYFCKCFLSPVCDELADKLIKLGANPNRKNRVSMAREEEGKRGGGEGATQHKSIFLYNTVINVGRRDASAQSYP